MDHVSSQLRRIADDIDQYSATEGHSHQSHTVQSNNHRADIPDFGTIAEKIYKARRIRDESFGLAGLFSEPAWDILLDLLINEYRLVKVSVKSACIASRVPPTTALRWLATLEEFGLISRHQDAADARRTFVTLTKVGRKKICDAITPQVEGSRMSYPSTAQALGPYPVDVTIS